MRRCTGTTRSGTANMRDVFENDGDAQPSRLVANAGRVVHRTDLHVNPSPTNAAITFAIQPGHSFIAERAATPATLGAIHFAQLPRPQRQPEDSESHQPNAELQRRHGPKPHALD